MNRLINLSRVLPTPAPDLTVAYTPIRLEMPGRQPLELRLTAPATGDTLPIVILSHGFGPSKYLLTINGVGHGLGGIAGLDARETEAEEPDALEATRRLTLAWLRSLFSVEQGAWARSQTVLRGSAAAIATITAK